MPIIVSTLLCLLVGFVQILQGTSKVEPFIFAIMTAMMAGIYIELGELNKQMRESNKQKLEFNEETTTE